LFIGKKSEKIISVQLDLDEDYVYEDEEFSHYPDSILICSDGSVLCGTGSDEIAFVVWYPCFEMVAFFAGVDELDMDAYIFSEPSVKNACTDHFIPGPLEM